jgi:tripartite-type tricarboxylate transporter receptor subunit TctC
MGVFHEHARTRMRAQTIVRLSQGLTLQQVADDASPVDNTPEQFAKVLDAEINKYAELVKATGLQVE